MNLIVFSNYSIVPGNHYYYTYVLVISVASIVTWYPRAPATFRISYQSLLVAFTKMQQYATSKKGIFTPFHLKKPKILL